MLESRKLEKEQKKEKISVDISSIFEEIFQ